MSRADCCAGRVGGRGRLARVAVLIAAGLLACAVPSRPLPIEPHLPFPGGGEAARPDLALGVAPFRDVRSSLSRERQRPPIRPYWLGLRRTGENSTGDRSFLGDLAESARRDATRTLEYAQIFGEVRLVEEGSVPDDLDFVLVGEIEELVGFQYQNSEIGVLQAAPFSTRIEAPIGTARVRFQLLGPLGQVWSERIEVRLQTDGLSMERAALDALAAAHERLAIALRRELVGEVPEVRAVPVRVLDACGLGPKRARRLIDDVNEIFVREAGLRFRAVVESWLAPPEGGPEELLDAASELEAPEGGLVLALAPADRSRVSPLVRKRSGLARQLGRHAVVICASVEPKTVTMAHEMAHLFGAVHATHRGSIMHPVADFDARFFDAVNRRILRTGRRRPLDGSSSPEFEDALAAVYRDVAQDTRWVEPESLGNALRVLE